MSLGTFTYDSLDSTGEARAAADRMEARAREPASHEMFRRLVRPLIPTTPVTGDQAFRILEVGCGTGALARRMRSTNTMATVHATDKSHGMLEMARSLAAGFDGIEFQPWDVNDESTWPFDDGPFDLIVSSVMVPYLGDPQTESLVRRLSARLAPGGMLAFIEQDLLSESVYFPNVDILGRVFSAEKKKHKTSLDLGLRPMLKRAGLTLLPRESFLWTDDEYGVYTREMLGRVADDARRIGDITSDERAVWGEGLAALAEAGEFYYGLVYHRIAGRK